MKALIIGNGGREHALAWKIEQSSLVDKVFVAPGNGGTALEEKIENINISVNDIDKLVSFAKEEKVDLTINLNIGSKNFTAYTMDLTKKYIEINADYRS